MRILRTLYRLRERPQNENNIVQDEQTVCGLIFFSFFCHISLKCFSVSWKCLMRILKTLYRLRERPQNETSMVSD